MGTEQSKSFWALIITPGMKFVGQIHSDEPTTKHTIVQKATEGRALQVNPAYEITVNVLPFRTPGGDTALRRETGAMPVIMTLYGADLYITEVTALQFFDDMKEADVDGYKRLVQDAEENAQAACTQRGGILSSPKGNRGA